MGIDIKDDWERDMSIIRGIETRQQELLPRIKTGDNASLEKLLTMDVVNDRCFFFWEMNGRGHLGAMNMLVKNVRPDYVHGSLFTHHLLDGAPGDNTSDAVFLTHGKLEYPGEERYHNLTINNVIHWSTVDDKVYFLNFLLPQNQDPSPSYTPTRLDCTVLTTQVIRDGVVAYLEAKPEKYYHVVQLLINCGRKTTPEKVKEYLPFVSSGSARQVDALFVLDTATSISSLKGTWNNQLRNISLYYGVVDFSKYDTAKRFPATITPVSVSNS